MGKVVMLHKQQKEPKLSGWQGQDDVFLHRSQIYVGAELMYYGRTDHGSIWRVTGIRTTSKHVMGTQPVQVVQRMKDDVELTRIGNLADVKQVTFGYMSYSAIWRMNTKEKKK
jgi:hypothetical protein